MKKALLLSIILATLASCINNGKWKLAPETYILDKEMPIKSLDELTGRLNGKPIYIDRWATWCSPCLEEFKHSESLHEFLKSNKIEIVYLNSDSDLEQSKWFEFITSHNLRGYHLRLNSILKEDLVEKGIFIPRIPQYLIIGKDGEVIKNDALRPSNEEDLYTQLKNSLNQ